MLKNKIRWIEKVTLNMAYVFGVACLFLLFARNIYAETIPVEVAKAAAANMLPKFYKGDWQYFEHFVYYDLEDQPKAYAIVFLKSGVKPTTLEEVEARIAASKKQVSSLAASIAHISNISGKSGKQKNMAIAAIQKQINNKRSNDILGLNSFATVVTGAMDSMPVVLKCHKGLPSLFVTKTNALELAKRAYPNKQLQVDRFLSLGTFDEAIKIRLSSPTDRIIHESQSVQSIVVDTNTSHIKTMSQLRDKKHKIELNKRTLKKIEGSLPEEPDAWEKKNKKKWAVFRNRFPSDDEYKTKEFQTDEGVEEALPVQEQSKKSLSTKRSESEEKGAPKTRNVQPLDKPQHSTEE
jgi:hypothetical protein